MDYDKTIWHDAQNDPPQPGVRVIVLKMDRKNGKIQKGCFSISIGSAADRPTEHDSPDNNKVCWNPKDVILWARLGLPQGTGDPALEMEISALQHVIDIMQKQMTSFSGRTLDNIIQNLRMILDSKVKHFKDLIKQLEK